MCSGEKAASTLRDDDVHDTLHAEVMYWRGYREGVFSVPPPIAPVPRRNNSNRSGALFSVLLLACIYLAFYCAGYSDGKKQANRG